MVCASTPLLDAGAKRFSVFRSSVNSHRMSLRHAATVQLGIMDYLDKRQEIENPAVGQPVLGELLNKGVSLKERDRCNVVSVHLCGHRIARLVRPAHIQVPFLAHAYGEVTEIVRGQSLSPQIKHPVYDGMRAGACRICLQTDAHNFPIPAEIAEDRSGIVRSAKRAHEAAKRSFQDFQTACEILLGEIRSDNAAL